MDKMKMWMDKMKKKEKKNAKLHRSMPILLNSITYKAIIPFYTLKPFYLSQFADCTVILENLHLVVITYSNLA